MMREVFDEMGVTTPPYNIELRVRKSLIQAHLRVVAQEKLNHAVADLPFVADDPDVPLPADFLEIRSVRRGAYVMREITDPDYAALIAGQQVESTTQYYDGPVSYIMREPNRLTVWPTPTSATSAGAELWYVARPAPMAVDENTPAGIPDEWHELLVYMVLAKIGPDQKRPMALEMARQLRTDLHNHVAERTGDNTYSLQMRGYPYR
jgi:hypothetical protein